MITRSSIVLRTALTLIAAIGVSGCGSSATTSTATSPSSISRCAVTVNGDGQVPAAGATKSFTVSAARECAWAASVEATWLAIKTGASGQGDGTVEVAAAANPDPLVRRGSVVLNEQRVEVMQAAAECGFSLSDPSDTFDQTGGSGAFDVRTSSALCTWTASSDAPWIAVRSGASGKGNAAVEFDVSASAGTAARTGTITAAGLRFTVTQQPSTTQPPTTPPPIPPTTPPPIPPTTPPPPATCSYAAAPLAHTVATAGGVITVAVTTGPQCPWTASSSNGWITIAGPSSFSGPGTATFNVAAGSGPARSGTAVVAGQTVAISQGSACAFAVSPEGATVPAAGGSGRVDVSTANGCAWTVASSVPWITFAGGGSRTGSGDVQYHVAATSGSRSGTMTIAGRTLTVTQAAAPAPPLPPPPPPCSYKLDPKDRNVSERSEIMKIEVKTADSCPWTATSNASWIRIGYVSPGGAGDGVVWIGWQENNGEERVGTVTIGTATFTLTQKRDKD